MGFLGFVFRAPNDGKTPQDSGQFVQKRQVQLRGFGIVFNRLRFFEGFPVVLRNERRKTCGGIRNSNRRIFLNFSTAA